MQQVRTADSAHGSAEDAPASATAPGAFPLSGIRVLDLTHVLAGPFCSLLLAQLGADVIKIERPGGGDVNRTHGAVREDAQGRRAHGEIIHLGRNKRSLALDLSSEDGRDLFKRLAGVADVVVENFRPTTMDKLGLGYSVLREVNPRLIYACISGFGHLDIYQSPYWDRPAFNMIAQAMSGVLEITGQRDGPPVPTAVALGDFVPALYATIGILAALEYRGRTSVGQLVDVAMYDALIPLTVRQTIKYALTGQVQQRGQELFNSMMGIFKTGDGYVGTTVVGDPMWERCCKAIGRPDLIDHELMNEDHKRGRNYEEHIRPILEAWASDKTKHQVTEIFLAHDVTAGPVQNTKDVFEDPHIAARNMLVEVGDMVGGTVKVPGLPIKFSHVGEVPPVQASWLGANTAEVLREYLGLDDEAILDLERGGTIRRSESGPADQ